MFPERQHRPALWPLRAHNTPQQGADPITRVEMASTGEVACFGVDQHEALLKSMLSTGFKLPTRTKAILVSIGPLKAKTSFISYMKSLVLMGYTLYCTGQTAEFYRAEGIECVEVVKPGKNNKDSEALVALDMIKANKVDLLINVPGSFASTELTAGYHMRRACVDFGCPLLTNIQLATALVQALERVDINNLQVRSWNEYVKPGYRKDPLVTQPGTTPLHRPLAPLAKLPPVMQW